ncbi:MAG: methyltransferase domain-containing protein [Vicinamibacteria bacterium]|nr:methyltransferase domain-containing protein [Vicinamibacteria bacterium]
MELGCGSGVFLERAAAATGCRIVALDLAVELLARARDKLAKMDCVDFSCGNAERLPFSDQVFDVVYGSSILHHLDLDAALSEIYRVLRPGGRLVFAEPNLLNPQIVLTFVLLPRRWVRMSPNEMAFTRFRARRALEAVGFVEVGSEPYDFLHPIVPAALVGFVARLSHFLERVPLLREIAGSQIIRARRP